MNKIELRWQNATGHNPHTGRRNPWFQPLTCMKCVIMARKSWNQGFGRALFMWSCPIQFILRGAQLLSYTWQQEQDGVCPSVRPTLVSFSPKSNLCILSLSQVWLIDDEWRGFSETTQSLGRRDDRPEGGRHRPTKFCALSLSLRNLSQKIQFVVLYPYRAQSDNSGVWRSAKTAYWDIAQQSAL